MKFLKIFKPKIVVTTHDGSFHADDVFACATLSLWAENRGKRIKIVRTRDEALIAKSDIVLDVGMVYDPVAKRFDHHQKQGAGERENNPTSPDGKLRGASIPYASFGLIWKYYGEEVCAKYAISQKVESKEVWKMVDERLVSPVDARDNGVNISSVNHLGVVDHRISNAIYNFNPTWLENGKLLNNNQFEKALEFAKEIVKREIAWAEAEIEGSKQTLEIIKAQNYPEILILEKYVDWEREVAKHKNIKFVISKGKERWSVQSARDDLEKYDSNRAQFPESWWGLRDEALEKESGVVGAIFCARGGWFMKALTKEVAISLGEIALQSQKQTN